MSRLDCGGTCVMPMSLRYSAATACTQPSSSSSSIFWHRSATRCFWSSLSALNWSVSSSLMLRPVSSSYVVMHRPRVSSCAPPVSLTNDRGVEYSNVPLRTQHAQPCQILLLLPSESTSLPACHRRAAKSMQAAEQMLLGDVRHRADQFFIKG